MYSKTMLEHGVVWSFVPVTSEDGRRWLWGVFLSCDSEERGVEHDCQGLD